MKKEILKHMLLSLVMAVILVSCTEQDELRTCLLQKVSIVAPENYQQIDYNANGTIAYVTIIFNGVESQRYDYSYTSDKLSIYLTDVGVSNHLTCEIALDTQGRPISRTEDGTLYERYVYSGDKLDHVMSGKDSIVFTYSGTNKNPDKSEFYDYNASNQTWSKFSTTTFTFDEKRNPLKGLILPLEPNWNLGLPFFYENNNTSYTSEGDSWTLAYTYNAEGYPVSRTLTSNSQDYSETKDFTYNCH